MNFAGLTGRVVSVDEPLRVDSGIVVNFVLEIDSRKARRTRINCCAWDAIADRLAEVDADAAVAVIGRIDHDTRGAIVTASEIWFTAIAEAQEPSDAELERTWFHHIGAGNGAAGRTR